MVQVKLIYVIIGSYWSMEFGVCRTDTFTNTSTKLILLRVTRSGSPELVFYRFNSQGVYNPEWH
jgi:hypothetical protein